MMRIEEGFPGAFDILVQTLGQPGSRREALRAVAAALFTGAGATGLAEATAAKRRGKDDATRRAHARVSAEGKTKKKTICTCTDASVASCRTLKTRKTKASAILRKNACAYSGPCRSFNPCSSGGQTPLPPSNCVAGQIRCNGTCVTGICCAADDCAPRGDFCKGNECTCKKGNACTGSEICRGDRACCIPEGQPDQGFESNCCSLSSANGVCQCLANNQPDGFDPRNCCSGMSLGSICCIAKGQNNDGSSVNCCSEVSSGGVCACRAIGSQNIDHPGQCCSGFSSNNQCVQPTSPAAACTEGGAGVVRGQPWVVCRALASAAWLSSTANGGKQSAFDPGAACASLGYGRVGKFGGTSSKVCGIDTDSSPSCANPGTESYLKGDYDPDADYGCGAPGVICNTVMWECLR